ncbi:MAG: hypothetical protein PHY47_19155 [Lachnospiraceae bacterium]|nr:hypothetical protein [Lachnospiraceae bacterium]
MLGNIEIFFAENPNTPPRTTKNMTFEERKANWDKRIEKAKEQATIEIVPYCQVFSYINDFFTKMMPESDESNNKRRCDIISLDDDNQAIILDNGIIAQGYNWIGPKWNEKERKYTKWDPKYNVIQERFRLNYPSDIIWMKFTKKHHLGVVAKSFDINYRLDNTSGKLVTENDDKWDDSFVFIFPLTEDILNGRKTGEIERAVGNYLIAKGVPIIDFYSHNY